MILEPDVPMDPGRVHGLMNAWARHEMWYQLGCPDLDTYEWPVPGTREIAHEGERAYMAYRDFLAAAILSFGGHHRLLDDLQHLVSVTETRAPGIVGRLLQRTSADDPHFHKQWANLFSPDPQWGGLSHETLGAYVRKYEVERPLRVLVWLRELQETGTYDPSLRRFRDKAGRLKKGLMVAHVTAGFTEFPALRGLLEMGYSSTLRNMIGHNEYEIDGDTLRSLDGSWACTESDVFARYQALCAVHNALVWLESTSQDVPADLASRGVVGIGWMPHDTAPRLLVLQLAAFRRFDPAAEWVSSVSITVRGETVATTVRGAQERSGPLLPSLRPVLAAIAEARSVACDVVGVVPCLHADGSEHQTYQLGPYSYCELDVVDRGVVPATVTELD